MKLLMPSKQTDYTDNHALLNTNSIRHSVVQAAESLHARVSECDYNIFYQYAFVGEAYRIALTYSLTVEDKSDVKVYLARCIDVFEGRTEEMTFLDDGFPEFIREGFDRLLLKVQDIFQIHVGVVPASQPTFH